VRLPEYDTLDATALAALAARAQVTPLELLEAALERADARNPRLNAIVARYDDDARRRASAPPARGAFRGVPFLFKDLVACWAGHPMTGSSRLQEGWTPETDSELVRRALGAGLVPFGQTNTPEFGIFAVTEPRLRGPARNPWSLAHTTGGSSGGSAAAVAARIVPAAHGSDAGGSIRIPASACGVFGLKPTRARTSLGPAAGEIWSGLGVEGVLTRSVRDAAAMLDVLSGPAPGDPYSAPSPARPFAAEVGAPPGRLRVAFTTRPFFSTSVHPDCVAAVHDAAKLLTTLGHDVEEAHPAFDRDALVRAYLVAVAAGIALEVRLAAERTGRRPSRETLEDETLALAAAGRALPMAELAGAQHAMHLAGRALAAFHERYDVLLTPTLARPPGRIGDTALGALDRAALRVATASRSRRALELLIRRIGEEAFEGTGYTMLFNQTGQPAMSVPLSWNREGLPIGVQLAAPFGDEATLFRLAAQLEAARPWAARMPPCS
jgi:amidase